MRYFLCLALIGVFILAACTGQTAPTQTPQPTQVPETPTQEIAQQQTTPIVQITVPPVGQLIAAATEDPEAGLVFHDIIFTQARGSNAPDLTIELHNDGTLIRNGQTSSVSADQVTAIDNMLDELNFFGIQGVFEAAAPNPDDYVYSITVDRAGSSRTINTQDTYTPEELKNLFAAIIALGAPGQSD